jgi:23S rRNA pseudouridine2605 synthase
MNDQSRPDEQRPETNRPEANEPNQILEAHIDDPIGDETDGEAAVSSETEEEIEKAEDEAETAAEDDPEIEPEEDLEEDTEEDEDDQEAEPAPKKRPSAKLERLQKILAQSGVASRRKAEEMIEQGRVQVNGKVVTELGTKADMGRDHIRVDGKLLQGAERLRYFVLNKPRGFVTTVKDPEGRPTVMQFFDKMKERLYPVGRLDYMSEGLLLVTNDGELANRLTKASSGVEKTYLVKVAGIPSEGELDVLRSGVAIEKGKPGTGKVRTSPARIRQVRQGDNPWYEVVIIEGRNRELRKMFEEVGHFVEKIRRVGYGPLILDQEPGNLRELDAQELDLLRKAADGKLKTPKAKEIRRRNLIDSLPPQKPAFKSRGERSAAGPKDYKPKKAFGTDRPARSGSGPAKFGGPGKSGTGRPTEGTAPRPAWKKDAPPARATGRFEGRPPARFTPESTGEGRPSPRTFGDRPAAGRTFGAKPAGRPFTAKPGAGKPFGDKPSAGRSFPGKPTWKKPEAGSRESSARPGFKKPFTPRPESTRKPAPENFDDLGPKKSFKFEIEPVQDFGRSERPSRPTSSRPPSGYSGQGRAGAERTGTGRSDSGRTGSTRPSSPRPFRSEGGLARPFTTSSGKPRPGGARPSSKPGREGGRPSGPSAGRSDSRSSFAPKRPFRPREEGGASASRPSRPFTPRSDSPRPERRFNASEGAGGRSAGGTGWKPKPNFGGGKSASGGGFKPKSSGSFKPKSGGSGSKSGGYKGSSSKPKPGGFGAKRSGPRPGGKRPGGKRP